MSITRSLVQMMDGDIKVESEKGRGTTFIVKVTLKASSRSLGDDDPSAALTHLRVLLVDDDPVTLDHAKLELATLGIAADACPNAAAAALQVRDRRAQGAPYHFLLTDLKMPEMSGLELTRAIREFDGGETAVIIMTGYDFDANSAAAKGAGIDGFLYKPLFSNSLRREFLSVMHKRGIDLSDDAKAPAAPLGASLEGRKVLIAEDVDLNAEILADLLEIEGVSCERAENGAVALKLFTDSAPNHYDAVLMDMRMPEMDGLAATRAIRALDRPDAKTVPIVAMTANAFEDDVQRSLQAGLNAHLAKPVEPERLYEVLRLLIAGRDAKG
ncbi:MAG: response regulator [Planctomycetes bacterium]|nr:response regulator [Planctomycetota bacterium]